MGLGLCAWAALFLAVQIWIATPVALLAPLLVLAGLFEAIFALHVGVERIGRYLETTYESDFDAAGPRWEHTAHAFGRTSTDAAGQLDPLFSAGFVSAALLNVVPVALLVGTATRADAGLLAEVALYGGLHVLFILRVMRGRRFAARQRSQELELFARLTQSK